MAATRSSFGNVYEDFEPNFQWKEDESSNILVLHLPEFVKEEIKITYVHSSSVIRVTGEKQISKNKWRRFNKAFPVPHNCNVQKIQAKLQAPNLTITLPKTTPIPSSNQDLSDTKTQEIPKQPQIARPSEKKNEEKPLEKDDEKERKEQVEAKSALLEKEGKNDKKREEMFSKEEDFANKKLKKEDEALTKPLVDDHTKDRLPEKEDEALTKPLVDDTKDQLLKKDDKALTKPLVDDTKDQIPKKEDKSALKYDEKAKGVMAFRREIGEDNQALVNIGVAILVIAALGAYISYTYGSSSNSNN